MNVFIEGALLMIAGLLFFLIWFGITQDDDQMLPSGWWIMPVLMIGMLLITGALV